MSETASASSSASSSKLNSSANKRTLSDAGLDDPNEGDHHNSGKRVVVFETFKLFDVQSAVSQFAIEVRCCFFFSSSSRKNWMQNFC